MTKELKLYKEIVSIVDDEDYEKLKDIRWGFDGRYAYTKKYFFNDDGEYKYKKFYLHRVIMNTPKGLDTDHINGNKLDNRRANLRIATRSQNNANQRKTRGTSRYKGVCWFKQKSKWKAEIKLNGKRKHLGLFENEYDAAMAYNKAAKERFNSYAKLN